MPIAKKKLWIDALTPKQALFTESLVKRAPSSIEITVTTRNYSELNQFVSRINLAHTSIGRHGGGELLGKLEASVEREKELIDFAKNADFDFSLSYISPEASRVTFGLGIPHFISSDSPHASAPSRLAVPLSRKVFTPYVIAKERWTQYGVSENQVKRYHALDPWCWLVSLKTKHDNLKMKNRVLVRLEEWSASYAKRGKGISDTIRRLIDLIMSLGDYEILLLPRYDDQRKWAKQEFGKACTVPDSAIDGVKAILDSDLIIGGGATMTQEAALLGIPNISYFPSAPLDVFEEFYHPKGISVKASNPDQLFRETKRLLENIEEEKRNFDSRARKIVSGFEDPSKFIFERILE